MKQMFLQRRGDNSQTLLPQKWLLCLLTLLLSVFGTGQANAAGERTIWSIDFATVGSENNLEDKAEASISGAVSDGMGTVTLGSALNSNFGLQTGSTWIYRTSSKGLYSSNGGDRIFGVFNAKKDQKIVLNISAEPTPTNATLESSNGTVRTYKVTADGTVKFNIARYNTIYSISVNVVTYDVKFYSSGGWGVAGGVTVKNLSNSSETTSTGTTEETASKITVDAGTKIKASAAEVGGTDNRNLLKLWKVNNVIKYDGIPSNGLAYVNTNRSFEMDVTEDVTINAAYSNNYIAKIGSPTNGSAKVYFDSEERNSYTLYRGGTTVQVVATPDNGYKVKEWHVDRGSHISQQWTADQEVIAGSTTLEYTLPTDNNGWDLIFTPIFEEAQGHHVVITTTGDGTDYKNYCTATFNYTDANGVLHENLTDAYVPEGTTINLVATENKGEGYLFNCWNPYGDDTRWWWSTCDNVSVTGDMNIIAEFVNGYTVSAKTSPANIGDIVFHDVNADWYFPSGSRIKCVNRVTIEAPVVADYNFLGWYNGGDLLTTDRTIAAFSPSTDINYTAKYEYTGVKQDVDFAFSPSPLFLYVGGPAQAQPECYGIPGDAWDNNSLSVLFDDAAGNEYGWTPSSSSLNNSGVWTPGNVAGIRKATVAMASYGKYNATSGSYYIVTKPGRYSNNYNFSQDYGQYENTDKLIGALNMYATDPENISWCPNIQVNFNNNLTSLAGSDNKPGVIMTRGTVDVLATGGAVIKKVRVVLVNRNTSWEGTLNMTTNLDGNAETLTRTNHEVVKEFSGSYPTALHFSKNGNVAIRAIEVEYEVVGIGFAVTEFTGNLLDVTKTTGMPTAGEGVTYSCENTDIAHVDPNTGALTYLNVGTTKIKATDGTKTVEYTLKVVAPDAQYVINSTQSGTNTKYSYTVTGTGKLMTSTMSEIPGLKVQFGNGTETAIVKNVNSGIGVAVIGRNNDSAPLIPNGTNYSKPDGSEKCDASTTGTYYKFIAEVNGKLNISGYTTGTHHSEFYLLDANGKPTWQTNCSIGRDKSAVTSNETVFNVLAGKTYYLAEVNTDGVLGYFSLMSFTFTPTLEFAEGTSYIRHKNGQTSFSENVKPITGIDASQTVTWNCEVIKDASSSLSAQVNGSQIQITSTADADGGAIKVYPTIDGVEMPSLYYVITVPYLGNHTWDMSDMTNKSDAKQTGDWFFTWEVRLPGYIKDPIVVAQGKTDNTNAAIIDQTNGLTIKNNSNNSLGLAVTKIADGTPLGTDEEKKAVSIASVNEVNLVAIKDATVTLPELKTDWFVKVYLDPHTGNVHGSGCGCEFSVTNLKDLYGKEIDPSHIIMSYGTQWTENTEVDYKNPKYPFAGCLIFRVKQDGDVTFNFTSNGWDKIVKIEVTDTYSTELVLGPYYDSNKDRYGRVIGDKNVDYLRWNHSWVHRQHLNGTDDVVPFSYSGSPMILAENAKFVDHEIAEIDGPGLTTTLTDTPWKSNRKADYKAANMTVTGGVGNIKVISKAKYNAFKYNDRGEWQGRVSTADCDSVPYVLNANETWIAVGKLTEKPYPYTWDFTEYHLPIGQKEGDNTILTMTEMPGKAVDGSNKLKYYKQGKEGWPYVMADTTYGYWSAGTFKTNRLAQVEAGRSNGVIDDGPYYHIDAAGVKHYDLKIYKPLFANGAQLTYGFKAIPESEGLGFAIDQAYVGYKAGTDRLGRAANYPDYDNIYDQQISWDGTKISVQNTAMHITVPNVTEGMYIFVKGSTPTTGSTNVTQDLGITFETNKDNDVTIFKVTTTGDVVLDFAAGSHVKKIGVTDQVKALTYYGYATESRAINIDYNETRYFSANTEAFYVTKVDGWKNITETGIDYEKDLEVRTDAETNQIENQAYVAHGTGIVLHDKEIMYEKEQKNQFNDGNGYMIPLFVPACNVPETVGDLATKNLLVGSTDVEKPSTTINTSLSGADAQYYTMSIRYVPVGKDDNTYLGDQVYTSVPRFYRYVGTGGSAQTLEMKNKAYLYFPTYGVKSFSDYIKFDFDMDEETEATDIMNVDIIDNAAEEGTVYNLRGQAVNSKSAARGIYIKNGKKYYVK